MMEEQQASKAAAREKAKQARVHGCAKGGGKSPTALLRRALLTTTYIKLGRHSYTSSHSHALKSPLPDATIRPSGLKHTDHTSSSCPSSVLTHAHVAASHSRTVLSYLPDASCFPSGLKHADIT